MNRSNNAFPSGLKESKYPVDPFIWTDPVVHSGNKYRWHGPLDEVALSKYEWNGFLWFEGFFNQERMAPFFDELREMVQDKELLASDQVIQDPNTGDFRSVFDMHELFAHFNRLTRTPVSWAWSSSCSGVRSTFINRGLTTSWGLKSVGFTGHSDFGTWHSEDGMPRIRAVSASLMLTDNNEFNGVFQ